MLFIDYGRASQIPKTAPSAASRRGWLFGMTVLGVGMVGGLTDQEPEGTEILFKTDRGSTELTVPRIEIHSIIVVELEPAK